MFYKFLSDKFYNEVEKHQANPANKKLFEIYKSANTESEITKIMKEINYGYFVKDSNGFDNVLDKSRKNPEKAFIDHAQPNIQVIVSNLSYSIK
jgi:type I restriction-modification system DNA methylase subunit